MGARTEGSHADLAVDLCGVSLSGPLMLGSGGLGESAESLARFQETACAAVVTRTLRDRIPPDREVFPSPHLALGPRRRWLLNCEWGNLRPLDYWVQTGIPQASRRGHVIASLSGRDPADCARACQVLASSPAVMLEINFSCSHAGQLYGRIMDDPRHVAAVVSAVKQISDRPVIAKLGWSPVLETVATAAEHAGADAVAVTNSIGPGLDIDVDTARSRLGINGGFGGVSGPAIFPIALDCVRRVTEAVSVPVVGVGGVSTAEDVLKMIMVGASCVQIYTAALIRGARVFDRITADLATHLHRHGHASISDVRGAAREQLRQPAKLDRLVPQVDVERCQPCGACQRICPVDAIQVSDVARVDATACTGCGICVDACPPRFSALSLLRDEGRAERPGLDQQAWHEEAAGRARRAARSAGSQPGSSG
jgi:dihydroorotate dehydrogenase (NAD+) catalytic subunit